MTKQFVAVGTVSGNPIFKLSAPGACSCSVVEKQTDFTPYQSVTALPDFLRRLAPATDGSVTCRSSRNSRGRGDSNRTKRRSNRRIDNRCRNDWNNKDAPRNVRRRSDYESALAIARDIAN